MEAAPLNLDGCQSRQVTCRTVRKYNRMLTVDQRPYLTRLSVPKISQTRSTGTLCRFHLRLKISVDLLPKNQDLLEPLENARHPYLYDLLLRLRNAIVISSVMLLTYNMNGQSMIFSTRVHVCMQGSLCVRPRHDL